MTWYEQITAIEDLEDANLDAELIDELQRGSRALKRPIRFSTPTFKDYTSSEMKGCSKNSFPAFSITAGGCALMCDHCQAKILEPMIPATNPEMLEQKVRDLVLMQDLQGFLLSGGSNRQNEIVYERYYPSVEKLKREFPHLKIAIHSALLDETRAKRMESAGVDTAMMGVIGSNHTIRDVYKLERPLDDVEATLAAQCLTQMDILPHIVIGLHYGKILGEAEALDICSRHDIHALVLVVIMPFYAKPGTFETPKSAHVGRISMEVRTRLADRQGLLGCARPPGLARRALAAYAVMAGPPGIALPADGRAAVAAERAAGPRVPPPAGLNASCAEPSASS